jgi:hypothetical protein
MGCWLMEWLLSAADTSALGQGYAQGNVFGCGLLMDSDDSVAIFFTLNGILLGEFFFQVSFIANLARKLLQNHLDIINLYNKSIHCLLLINDLKERPICRKTNSNYSFCGSPFSCSLNFPSGFDIRGQFWRRQGQTIPI